jgi:hypothetical protein
MYRRLWITIQHKEPILKRIRFPRLFGNILPTKNRRPIKHLVILILLLANSSGGRLCREGVVRVVMGDGYSIEGLIPCLEFLFDPGYHCVVGVGDGEGMFE